MAMGRINKNMETEKHRDGKIGQLHYVHPSTGERYYLRMLLLIVKGACSYEALRTHNNVLFPTFKEACKARGLLLTKLPLGQHPVSLDIFLLLYFYSVR